MPKWNISSQFNNTSAWYVTFTANTSVACYRVFGYSMSKSAGAVVAHNVSISNVRGDGAATSTFMSGSQAVFGTFESFTEDGIPVLADQNAFLTITLGGNGTGTLAVAYDVVSK